MTATATLQAVLEAASADQAPERRGDLALRVADLFVSQADRYGEQQVELFDSVLERLTTGIEESARIGLAMRLAPLANAPLRLIGGLAGDPSAAVAGPILANSERLSDAALLKVAGIGSQAHLLAIAGRRLISAPVTDIIVDRGERPVLHRVAANAGAQFSPSGFKSLVGKAANDDDLIVAIGNRQDLPRNDFLALLASASAAARARLETTSPHNATDIRRIVAEVAGDVARRAADRPQQLADALAEATALADAGALDASRLVAYARDGAVDHVIAALSLMAELPVSAIDTMFAQPRHDSLLVVGRAIGLDWSAMRVVLVAKGGSGGVAPRLLEQSAFSFERLAPQTAGMALQIQRKRFQPA